MNSTKKTEEIKSQLRELVKQTLQEAYEAEIEEFVGYPRRKPPKGADSKSSNTRNGYGKKRVKSDSGEVELEVPRDRNPEFEPQILKKRQSVLDDLEDKIVALYSKGMTTRDIQEIMGDMYGVELSPSLISRLTDRMLPRLEEWQSRPLKEVYAVLWLDCIFYKVREEGKVINKAIYVVIGLGIDGRKEMLGFWISARESSGFWLGVLNDLKSRGVRDVFIFSVDGLRGLEEAIRASYPDSDIQRCVIHQIRNSLRYVSWKEKKELSKDLKEVYKASTIEEASGGMEGFEEKVGKQVSSHNQVMEGELGKPHDLFQIPCGD